jgi:hypothetical protein
VTFTAKSDAELLKVCVVLFVPLYPMSNELYAETPRQSYREVTVSSGHELELLTVCVALVFSYTTVPWFTVTLIVFDCPWLSLTVTLHVPTALEEIVSVALAVPVYEPAPAIDVVESAAIPLHPDNEIAAVSFASLIAEENDVGVLPLV